jgi:methyltransferase small
MRLYQPKKGYRYTSDTIFLWNFIRTRGLKGGQNFTRELRAGRDSAAIRTCRSASAACDNLKSALRSEEISSELERFDCAANGASDAEKIKNFTHAADGVSFAKEGENFICDTDCDAPNAEEGENFTSCSGDVCGARDGENFRCRAAFNPRAIYGDVLDVGAGCGILGFLLKRDFKSINLSLLEIQERNLEILKLNSSQNDLPAEILHADFAEFKSEKRFDFIVSNPPFYRERISLSKEPHMALSKSAASLSLQCFIRSANSHLKPNGTLIFCYDAGKIAKICEILEGSKLNLTRLGFVYPSCDKAAKLALIEARKGSRAQCEIILPLYAGAHGERTKEAETIYKSADLASVDYE